MNRPFLVAVLWLLLASAGRLVSAQETAPYPNGTSGIKAGTVPPPGHYILMYNRMYQATELAGPDGGTATGPDGEPLGFDLTVYANVYRFLHSTDYKILGADFSWNCVLPLVAVDTQIAALGVDDAEFRIADINVEPFVIEWHEKQFDFGFVYGFFAPTANRDALRPALPGKKHWTLYPGLAGTLYFDEDRAWSLSALSRYEIATRRTDIDIRAGDNFSFEWGFARNFDKVLDIGVSGYCSWQTTKDQGSGVTYPNVLDRAMGIGPEIQYFSADYKFAYHFRFWWEYAVRDRTDGTIATITIVKPF